MNKKNDTVEKKGEVPKKLPKDISQKIIKRIFNNLLIAIVLMAYFCILILAFNNMNLHRLMDDIKVFAGTFLIIGIYFLEQGYRKDIGEKAIYGIEMIVLCFHSLSIMHVIDMYQYNFQIYLLVSLYVIAIYYVFKSILIYTKGKKEFMTGYCDVSDIVKEEPQKKEAQKRKKPTKKKKTTEKKNTTKKSTVQKEAVKKDADKKDTKNKSVKGKE